MRLLVTRPEPDARELCAALEARGHVVRVEPLLRIEPAAGVRLELDGVQALIATSRNALRAVAAHTAFPRLAALPLVAVGPGTAAVACDMGFATVIEGPAAARDLPGVIGRTLDPGRGALLHLAGETLAFDLAGPLAAAGFELRASVVYRSRAAGALDPATRALVGEGGLDGVILMSPATAETYARLILAHGLQDGARRLVHLCLSRSVAAALTSLGDVRVEVAAKPSREEMLALVARVAAQSA